jgi:gliding motility associated protien GldN
MKNIFLAFILISSTLVVNAQAPNLNNSTKPKATERPLDGYYKKTNIENARVTPYANLRESDVMFSKRVWREIDVRDKVNTIFASPKSRLITILTDAIQAGELTAYDATPFIRKDDVNGDEFSLVLSAKDAMGKLQKDSVQNLIRDQDGTVIGSEMIPGGDFDPAKIEKFRIKEDWIFDKQRSVFEPRIIGIAPLFKKEKPGSDYQPAFWIYFPEARHLLATKAAVNRTNDMAGLSYDDIFMKRIFSSYIVKESNPNDKAIKFIDGIVGIDKLYESERVKKALMDFEHDLWSY